MADYLVLLISLLLASSMGQNENCPSSSTESYYLDVFENIRTKEPGLAKSLTEAPLVQGVDKTTPAYEFAGVGSGLSVTKLSDDIRRVSCAHNEVTFTGRVFIRDSQSDGPLLELAYSGGLENGLAVYLLVMDAAANEIALGYRHQGRLHSEFIPIRLISGRWRNYAVSLSGNLLSFYFDCELVLQRAVPLPDYCANDSSVVLSVAASMNAAVEYTGRSGLYVYMQNVGIHFGPNGVRTQCPDIPQVCPSCGQFFSLLEKLMAAQDELETLRNEVGELESRDSTCTGTPPTFLTSINCIVDDGPQRRVIKNEQFLLINHQTSICFCNNGIVVCEAIGDVEVITVPPPVCPGAPTTDPVPIQSDEPPTELVTCTITLLGIDIAPNQIASQNVNGNCKIFTCVDLFGQGSFTLVTRDVMCEDPPPARYADCADSNLSLVEVETSSCCKYCDACSFVSCQENAECDADSGDSAMCVCKEGYSMTEDDRCVDIDECSLSSAEFLCPKSSACQNTNGSYNCTCFSGYSEDPNNENTCMDDDECTDGSHNCTVSSSCMNTMGGFQCMCHQGYQKDNGGTCQPVCDSPCQNGGECISPNTCSCTTGFTGAVCEVDIDECFSSSVDLCPGSRRSCVNTVGGYFCRCAEGYQERNSTCADVDECSLRIHNCMGTGSSCRNTIGGFLCLCPLGNCAGRNCPTVNCTGTCIRRGVRYADKQTFIDRCRTCTCLGGEVTCRKAECNCKNLGNVSPECCSECRRRDCLILNGTVTIRPGATWVDPSNRCLRYNCLQSLTVVVSDDRLDCPELDCPEVLQTTPMGKCCPVCMLPTCTTSLENKQISMRNGCEVCTCQNSSWTCSDQKQCSAVACAPSEIVFNKGGCCPVCRHEILGFANPQCLT